MPKSTHLNPLLLHLSPLHAFRDDLRAWLVKETSFKDSRCITASILLGLNSPQSYNCLKFRVSLRYRLHLQPFSWDTLFPSRYFYIPEETYPYLSKIKRLIPSWKVLNNIGMIKAYIPFDRSIEMVYQLFYLIRYFTYLLGSINPHPFTVNAEPFSTSVFKFAL